MSDYSPAEFGAALDGVTNDRPALQQAIDTAHHAGGGTVIIPAGRTVLSGSINLQSHVELSLEPGSRLVASVDPFDYRSGVFIEAYHAENIAVTGTGEIDGRGAAFMLREHNHHFEPNTWHPQPVRFEDCSRLRLLNFTLRDSAGPGVGLDGCDDVVVRGVSILNNAKIPDSACVCANASRNVRVSDCLFRSGGDCLVLCATVGARHYGPCEAVVVRDCIFATTGTAISIGPDTAGHIRNIVISDSVISRCQRGVGLLLRDEGSIENVSVHNLFIESQLFAPVWRGASEPVCVSARSRLEHGRVGHIRRVRFADIMARSEGGVFLEGSADCVIEDVRFENVALEINKLTPWPSRRDVRPPDERGLEDVVTAGFHLRHGDRVTMRDCSVRWGGHCPACYGPALRVECVEHFRNEHFEGHDAHFGDKKLVVA